MAQVRKLQNGDVISKVKLFKHEGLGDYNVDDLVSLYASSVNNQISNLDLNDTDRQKVLDYAGKLISGIKNGTVTGRDVNGNFVTSDKSLSSSGINKRNIFGYKKDDDFYKNVAADVVSKIFQNASPYIAPAAKKSEEAKDYKLNFTKTLSDYYYNGQDIDLNTWDYNNAKSNLLERLNDERTKVESGDYKNKADILARIDDTMAALKADNLEQNISVGNRLGLNLRNFLFKPSQSKSEKEITEEEKAKQEANAAKTKLDTQREAAEIAYGTGVTGQKPEDIQEYFDQNTRKSFYGTMKNGVFYPASGRPFALDKSVTWNPSASNYYTKNNLTTLGELINNKEYADKIPSFYESIKAMHNQENIPNNVKSWFTSYKPSSEKQDDETLLIRTNDFTTPYSSDFRQSENPRFDIARILGEQFGFRPHLPIEKGSATDLRLNFTEKVGEAFNKFSDSVFGLDANVGKGSKKKIKYVEKKAIGGEIPKFQNPAGRIKAKDTSKWNRASALRSYDWGADMDNYLKSGDLAGYIAAFNGGEDIYDQMVGDTDYFAGKNIRYDVRDPLAEHRQRTFRNTNKGFDDAIRSSIQGYGVTEGTNSFDNLLGDRTYNRTLGRISDADAEFFNAQLRSRGAELFKTDAGHYRLRPLSGVNTPASQVVNQTGTANANQPPVVPQNTVQEDTVRMNPRGIDKRKPVDIRMDDILGTGRLLGTIATNNAIARGLRNSLSPLLLDPVQIRRQVVGDLATRNYMENLGAEANRIGARPITSDASLALGQALDFNNRAGEYRIKGYLADKQAIDRTTAEARQAAEQNAAARVDVANKNRASMLGIRQAKANIEAQRKSANWQQAIAPWLMDKEMKIAQNRKINNELEYNESAHAAENILNSEATAAANALEAKRQQFINNGGNSDDWYDSPEYKAAKTVYDNSRTTASENYRKQLMDARRRTIQYRPFIFFKSGGKLTYEERSLLQRAKDFNKSLLEDNKLFHKIIMESKKENNKLIMSLSGLTKELIIKSMTL